jgi:SAM-dependent methyltransferase
VNERPLAQEWDAQAGAWARWTRTPGHDRHYPYNMRAFLGLVPPPSGTTLDLGCGEGRLGQVLRGLGHRLVGVDVSPSLARLASETGAYDEVLVADAASLPFPDGRFELVIAFMSLQDMDDAPGVVREAARVLAPQGQMVAAFLHPFGSAHLGREPAEQRSYFESQRTLDEVNRDGIAFAFHQIHRSLEDWLALFFESGLRVEDLREPRPTEAEVRAEPELAKSRAKPAFLHIRCRR